MGNSFWEEVQAAWLAMSYWEVAAVAFAVVYVVLAAREHVWCWPAALLSSAIYFGLLYEAKLYLETGLQVFYFLMALVGWWAWTRTPKDESAPQRPIVSMTKKEHGWSILIGGVFTVGFGYYFSVATDAAMPFWDAFTTGFALWTTWLVTQKKLENWLYWVVIDTVSIYLYFSRGFYLSALLFVAYTVIAAVGYVQWLRQYRAQQQSAVA
ncbi:MAG TPA: nicotinamide riboside transporter PnuC [Cytophagales bacterium]|nr:nicotinamide riboside transporter PnuC [Cytophagales bacterium]HAA23271.1 nicotinamide riboside transporter PnuC [Cytophagales bacterium]HAP61841.1 nicotinamide riboside transporter PnuC [Cytophagales bacterium]